MFLKAVDVTFVGAADAPSDVYTAHIYHNRYEHQVAVIKFRDWGLQYDFIETGTPVVITYGITHKETMYGYVHHLSAERTVNNSFMEVTFIGASFPMKQASQAVYRDVTADQVVDSIASKYGFATYVKPHPRVWPQLAQAGETDWEFLVTLAKKSGYSLRVQNTELYFQPMMEEHTYGRLTAPVFTLRGPGQTSGWTMYEFTPFIGESLRYEDAEKGAVSVSGMDSVNNETLSFTKQDRNRTTRQISNPDLFDRFATNVVVVDYETAKHEAAAADERNSFPYRAEAVLIGDSTVRPDMPLFLDGLGQTYSGYWTALEVCHKFVEESRGVHTYTTVVTVGTDSLGDSKEWYDGAAVQYPTASAAEVVTPAIKMTQKKPKVELTGPSIALPRQVKGPFVRTENRLSSDPKSASKAAPAWKSNMKTLIEPDKASPTPYYVTSRLQKRGII
jgi:phage protein D